MEEAESVMGAKRRSVALQNMVDRGEAATLEEAAKLSGDRMRATVLQNMIDGGEAATLEEAQRVLSAKGRSAAVANNPLGATGFSMNAGVAAAVACGKYTRYPGVRWRPDSKKWRVQFSVKGKKVSLGSHATEEEAARVHDDYVRANGLSRPLHFPQEGEASSDVYRKQALARKSVAG